MDLYSRGQKALRNQYHRTSKKGEMDFKGGKAKSLANAGKVCQDFWPRKQVGVPRIDEGGWLEGKGG